VKAFNEGTIQAWDDSDLVGTVKWHTQEDEKVCIFCETMNGVEVPIGEAFWKKGETMYAERGRPGYFSATPEGEIGPDVVRLEFDYGDVNGPPLHPACRCFLDFVLESDE